MILWGRSKIAFPRISDKIFKSQQEGHDDAIPCILAPQGNEKAFRKNWARLIQKIYEVNPLVCPKCQGPMRIISFIEDQEVIKTILKHLGLWLVKSGPIPQAHAPPPIVHVMDGFLFQPDANE